ncbi:MAG: Ubiquinone/menaquinone biosynthesis C-methyltransferase UbiE [Pseudomonadota bacterium]
MNMTNNGRRGERMEGKVASGDGRAGARAVGVALRRALADLAASDAVPDAPIGPERFRETWAKETARSATPPQILQFAEDDDVDQALWQLAAVVQGLRLTLPNQQTPSEASLTKLVLAIALAVVDRLVRDVAPCPVELLDGVEVPMTELLAASVVACAWLNEPLLVRHHTGSASPYPANVIDVTPPLMEFDPEEEDFGLEGMKQELQQFLAKHYGLKTAPLGGSLRNLRSGLKQLRASQGIAPVVALRQGDTTHALSDLDRRQAFVARFGVPLFVYGHEAVPKVMRELEGDLLRHLQNSLNNLSDIHSHREETPTMTRTKVFISYAHKDETWRETLRVALAPQERKQLLEVWDDRRIGTGDDWRKEIDTALKDCRIAILLVSMHFLASKFINDVELVSVFERHEKEGLWIYPILVGPCDWEGEDQLKAKQMKLCKGESFEERSPAEQNKAYAEVAKEIRERLAGTGK